MRWRVLLLGALGGSLGLLAESTAYGLGDVGHWIPDLIVGWTFIAGGLAGWWRRPESGTGPLLAATGYAWFLGNFHGGLLGPIALFALHRGPLIHCVLSFPRWRPSSRLDRATVVAGYVAATVTPVAVSNPATIALGVLVTGAAARAAFVSVGPARRARTAVLPAAAVVGLALAGGSAALLAGIASDVVLAVDEVALVAVAVWVLAVLVVGRGSVRPLPTWWSSSRRPRPGRCGMPWPVRWGIRRCRSGTGPRNRVRTWTRQASRCRSLRRGPAGL
jgi:hypothetical protein